jgi:hypothetical protein
MALAGILLLAFNPSMLFLQITRWFWLLVMGSAIALMAYPGLLLSLPNRFLPLALALAL